MSPPPAQSSFRPLVWITAVLLLSIFASICLYVGRTTSPTFDEPEHIASGYSSLALDRHPYPIMNMQLSQMWMALPLLLKLHPYIPSADEQAKGQGFNGEFFTFGDRNDPQAIVRASRPMITLLGVLLGLTLFLWSRKLHGDAAGLVTLAFFCACPLMIWNSSFATADMATVLLFTLSLAALWRLLHRVSALNIVLAGVASGALAATKVSSLAIIPVTGVLLIARLATRRPLPVKQPWQRTAIEKTGLASWFWLALGLSGAVVAAYGTIWAIYGFHYSAYAQPMTEEWTIRATSASKFLAHVIIFCRAHRLLPEFYLYDLYQFTSIAGVRRAFLLGEYAVNGWWYFFPVAWLAKTSLPFMLTLLGAGTATVQRLFKRSQGLIDFYNLIPLVALGVIYGGIAMTGNLNIGIRHILPIYPMLFVLAGLITRLKLPGRQTAATLAIGLVVWAAGEAASVHPHYMAYFNEIAGGPANGHRILIDSSYEWGEEVPDLKKWLDVRATSNDAKRPVYLSYFGCAALPRYQINASPTLVMLPQFSDQRPVAPYALGPGTYVISATMLHTMYVGWVCGPWRTSLEQTYLQLTQAMLQLQAAMNRDQLALNLFLAQEGSNAWAQKIRIYDELRFARLCAWLRVHRPAPDSRIGYAMLIYELSEQDLQNALTGPPAELRENYLVKGTESILQQNLDFIK